MAHDHKLVPSLMALKDILLTAKPRRSNVLDLAVDIQGPVTLHQVRLKAEELGLDPACYTVTQVYLTNHTELKEPDPPPSPQPWPQEWCEPPTPRPAPPPRKQSSSPQRERKDYEAPPRPPACPDPHYCMLNRNCVWHCQDRGD